MIRYESLLCQQDSTNQSTADLDDEESSKGRISIQDLQKLFVSEEDEVFAGRLRSKADIAVLPLFEMTCRIIERLSQLSESHEAKKFIRFVVDSINNNKETSLFQKVSEENLLKRLERIKTESSKTKPILQGVKKVSKIMISFYRRIILTEHF